MKLRVPGYYKQFTCIADKCIDNCCFGGWQIDIDKETIDYYDTVQGDFGDRLKKYVDELNTALFYKISFGHIVDKTMCKDYNGWNIPNVVYWYPMPKLTK